MAESENGLRVETDDRVASSILDIIRGAKEIVILVSPYLKLWGHIQDQIMMARQRGVEFIVIAREDEKSNDGDVAWLEKQGVRVFLVEWLHAKIYMNERDLLVSSMNLTETSTKNSREIAMIVKSESDQSHIREYVISLSRLAAPPVRRPSYSSSRPVAPKISKVNKGNGDASCIRCGKSIDYDDLRPLCYDCYAEWAMFNNPDYKEVFCHDCGKRRVVTYARPRCRSCYSAAG